MLTAAFLEEFNLIAEVFTGAVNSFLECVNVVGSAFFRVHCAEPVMANLANINLSGLSLPMLNEMLLEY